MWVVAVTKAQIVLKLSIDNFLRTCHYSDSCVSILKRDQYRHFLANFS